MRQSDTPNQVVEKKKIPINANDPAMQDSQKEALDKTRNEVRKQLETARRCQQKCVLAFW